MNLYATINKKYSLEPISVYGFFNNYLVLKSES